MLTCSDKPDLGRRISDRWPGAKLVDRLHEPSWGYRALHVIVYEEGCWIEVQVRTYWQDVWAQISERLADAWGRQIRYGAPPDPPDDLGKGLSRTQVLAVVQDLSARVESRGLDTSPGPADIGSEACDRARMLRNGGVRRHPRADRPTAQRRIGRGGEEDADVGGGRLGLVLGWVGGHDNSAEVVGPSK